MKTFVIGLLLFLPLVGWAQDASAILENSLKQMEKMKAGMTPEMRKQFESTGAEQKLRDSLAELRETQKAQEQSARAAGLQAAAQAADKIPAQPAGGPVAEMPANREQLIGCLKPLQAEAAKALDAASTAAVKPLLNRGKTTGQLAMVFWANNELGKALYLLADACLSAPDDYLSLNNLGALLTLSGCANKSLPLLLYARKNGPENSTLLNNLGQAWLSLGYLDQAQQALQAAIEKDPDNAEAQHSLALLAAKQGDFKACIAHMQKVIEGGGVTAESIALLQQAAPEVNLADLIRPRFRQFYKDRTITKRFPPPSVPASYAEVVSRRTEIETYLRNLGVTVEKSGRTAKTMQAEFLKSMAQSFGALQQVPGMAPDQAGDLLRGYQNPLRLQATVMMANLDNPRYSTSYTQRLQRAAEDRKASEADVQQSLAKYGKEIAALRKESGKIEGGEGDIEGEKRLEEIRLRICALTQERQADRLAAMAPINTQYLQKVEDLLHQRLQEQTFWDTIVYSPIDATGENYQHYVAYLKDLYDYVRPAYPDASQLSAPCQDPTPTWANISGKPQSWEADHCDLDFGADVIVVGGRMTCDGWKVYANVKFGEFEYKRSVDPVTWETTGHSISAKAGREKEFEIGKHLGGKVEADVKTTLSFDANMNPVDLAVKASAGAEISGPLGGGAGVELGSMEISVSGGFNSSGPSIPGFGSDFLRN